MAVLIELALQAITDLLDFLVNRRIDLLESQKVAKTGVRLEGYLAAPLADLKVSQVELLGAQKEL
jgi:hypothetical protein